jgi:hypothetical protein
MEATILDGLRPSYIHTIICSTILYALQALIVNTIAALQAGSFSASWRIGPLLPIAYCLK